MGHSTSHFNTNFGQSTYNPSMHKTNMGHNTTYFNGNQNQFVAPQHVAQPVQGVKKINKTKSVHVSKAPHKTTYPSKNVVKSQFSQPTHGVRRSCNCH